MISGVSHNNLALYGIVLRPPVGGSSLPGSVEIKGTDWRTYELKRESNGEFSVHLCEADGGRTFKGSFPRWKLDLPLPPALAAIPQDTMKLAVAAMVPQQSGTGYDQIDR